MQSTTHSDAPIGRQLGYVAAGTAAILLMPLIAMQFTSEVVWTLSDFILMGALLMGAGTLFVLTARLVRTRQQRMILGAGLALLTAFIWVELAVGIVGSPFAGS